VAQELIRYRCFLPDLTGFAVLPCTGPNYQQSTSRRSRSCCYGEQDPSPSAGSLSLPIAVAERGGFEPPVPLLGAHTISSRAPSTARSPLRKFTMRKADRYRLPRNYHSPRRFSTEGCRLHQKILLADPFTSPACSGLYPHLSLLDTRRSTRPPLFPKEESESAVPDRQCPAWGYVFHDQCMLPMIPCAGKGRKCR
jgi:hypothetical protein